MDEARRRKSGDGYGSAAGEELQQGVSVGLGAGAIHAAG